MDLRSNLQYPLLKYLSEEFTGRFYQNELSCLNRMLILYHNRHIFSVDNNTSTFLDEYESYLAKPVNLWYLPMAKRQQIKLVRARMWYILKNNRGIFQQLLAREDYGSFKAPEQTIGQIYQWLQRLPHGIQPQAGLDLDRWKQELQSRFSHLLRQFGRSGLKKASAKISHEHFHQILTGKDQAEKQRKFSVLIDRLIQAQWIIATAAPQVYQFKDNHTGGRLRLAALYYTLDREGHIQARLNAPEIARLFNSWLSHPISWGSLVKAFQTEQLDRFDCGPNQPRYKYVIECRLLTRDL